MYGFQDFAFVFSGKKGFHVYVNDFHAREFSSQHGDSLRESLEKKLRSQIAEEVKDRIPIDVQVTSDVRRIIRLPQTLHGGTGFLSKYFASKSDLEKFELRKSIVFSMEALTQVRTIRQIPRIEIGDFLLDRTEKRGLTIVPVGIATFLVLSHYAVLCSSQSFYI